MTKQHQTYGKVPGVSVQTTGGSIQGLGDLDDYAIGTTIPGIRLWGHSIMLNCCDGIKCVECEMEEEIPLIFQNSSGFREVVYKMYILGKFKHARCEPEYEQDNSVLNKDTTNIGYDPSRVNWTDTTTTTGTRADMYIPQGHRISIDGEQYEMSQGNTFVHTSTGQQYHPMDLCHKHGEDAFKTLPPQIATECKSKLAEMSKVDKTVDGGIQIGDVQGSPQIQGNNIQQGGGQGINIDGGSTLTEAEQKSIRQSVAEKLSEQKDHFLRR